LFSLLLLGILFSRFYCSFPPPASLSLPASSLSHRIKCPYLPPHSFYILSLFSLLFQCQENPPHPPHSKYVVSDSEEHRCFESCRWNVQAYIVRIRRLVGNGHSGLNRKRGVWPACCAPGGIVRVSAVDVGLVAGGPVRPVQLGIAESRRCRKKHCRAETTEWTFCRWRMDSQPTPIPRTNGFVELLCRPCCHRRLGRQGSLFFPVKGWRELAKDQTVERLYWRLPVVGGGGTAFMRGDVTYCHWN